MIEGLGSSFLGSARDYGPGCRVEGLNWRFEVIRFWGVTPMVLLKQMECRRFMGFPNPSSVYLGTRKSERTSA